MTVKGLTPILNVSDLAASFAWFEKLGWKKLWEWGDLPGFGAVGSGNAEIFLCHGGQGGRGKPSTQHFDEETGGVWMSWWVATPADVDALCEHARQQGLSVTCPPFDAPWNVREFHLQHPDGHTFRVSAGLPES